MTQRPIRLLLLWLAVAGLLHAAGSQPRHTASLDGTWSFQLDPDSVGDAEQWFAPARSLPHTIQVPGAWDAQGFGPETEKMRHNFIGKGWYKRTVDIPAASPDQRFFLRFGGVYRDVHVWVNGQPAGHHLGYVSQFEFDITPHVQPGQAADITLRVNSEQQIDLDPLMGCLDIPDHLFSFWGGIWSHVSLERRNAAWFDELFVQSRVSDESSTVSARLHGDTGAADTVRLEIFGPDGRPAARSEAPLSGLLRDGLVEMKASLPGAPLWSPEDPHLHRAQLTLLAGGRVVDVVQTRFGIRQIEFRGHDIYLNGRKYYINGYGDDAVFVDTIAPPADKQFYLDRLKIAKSYGFNFVRHHSHFVAPEYYEACDEIGLFVSPELPIAYPRYYARATPKGHDLYRQEWTGAILRYRNHPSIFNWCMGNELWEGTAVAPELYAIARRLDPSRHVIDSDGVFAAGFVDGTKDRPTMDYYTAMFDILTMPLDNPDKFKTGIPKKPVITHEEGNFVHFPRLDSIALYDKTPFKPFWLTIARDKIAAQGLLSEVLDWSDRSEKLYYLNHKYNLEALRKNPRLSGYHWWLLQPWYPGSNGLLDVHRRATSITPEMVRQINGPVVLLQDGLGLNYRGDERVRVKFSVSNYSPDAFAPAELVWRATSAGRTVRQGTVSTPAVAQGAVAPLGDIEFALPDPAGPAKVRLAVELKAGGQTYTNGWETWVYPKKPATVTGPHPLYASEDLLVALAAFNPTPLPLSGQLPASAVYVVRQPNARLLGVAERGASVILLSPAGVFPTDVTTFKSAWWLGVFPGDNNAGTVVYDSPVTRAMAPDGWCDDGWFHLLQGSQTVILDDLPAQPDVIVRALNTHSAPTPFTRGLEFDFVWRNKSLLFETGVGRGSWIVSGFNFDSALRHGGPEGPWLLAQLLSRAQTLPRPKHSIPLDTLRAAVAGSPFAQSPGPLVEGFSRLLKHVGEKATGVTYRENDGESFRIRQEEALHELTWETAPVPLAARTTFVFAGGFHFQDPIPTQLGFGLTVDGVKVLDFDTTREPREWRSADGRYTLRYVPALNRSSWSETMGLLYLSVPADRLAAGRPVKIRIHSIGQENQRWFALNPYADILAPSPKP